MSSNIIGPLSKGSVAPSENIEKASGNLDDKKTPKDSVSPSYNIEKEMEDFLAPSAEIGNPPPSDTNQTSDKIDSTKESIKTQNMTNRSTIISKL